jgi:hypothetical protein
MSEYVISKRESRKRLEHIERLRASLALRHPDAAAWYDAHQATGIPGSGEPAFGAVVQIVQDVAEGQMVLVRWHNGTYTKTWLGERHYEIGTWLVVRTVWNDQVGGVWVESRPMRVSEWIAVLPANAKELYEDYWRFSRELDELDLKNLMMIAPVEDVVARPSAETTRASAPQTDQSQRSVTPTI